MEIDLELREPDSPELSTLPKSPAAPSVPSPERSAVKTNAMSYDEEEVERSRHFAQALKELKNLRPQLYSAAEYCESSYLYSDQKQAVLDNLKEYSVKALVNAVDHLGTVAYKFNELLGQETTGISSTELRAASLAQRMRSCQEHSDREGLKQQSLAKTMPINHKHYVLPDPYAIVEENATTTILRERFDSSQMRLKSQQPSRQAKASNPTAGPQLLPHSKDPSPSLHITSSNESWHFASDVAPISISTASTGQQQPISAGQCAPPPASGSKVLETSLPKGSFLSSSLYNVKSMPKSVEAGLSSSKYPNSAKVSATRSGSFTPIKTAPPAHGKGGPLSRSSTMVPESGSTKDSRPRSKACSECCSADGNPDLESSAAAAAASNKAKDALPPFGMEHQTAGETKCILACISDRMLLRRKTHVFLHKEKRNSNSDQRPVTADYQLNITYRPFIT